MTEQDGMSLRSGRVISQQSPSSNEDLLNLPRTQGGHQLDDKVQHTHSKSDSQQIDPDVLKTRASGLALGLSGKDLVEFVQQEMRELKKERCRMMELNFRREEAERQENLRREEIDLLRDELQSRDRQRNEDVGFLQRELEKLTQQRTSDSYRVRLPEFNDGDDIEAFLRHFESIATAHNWSENVWAARLTPLLHGKARKAFLLMEDKSQLNYHDVKAALLREFLRTPEYYRRQFREIRKSTDEDFIQFLKRLKENFNLWLKLATQLQSAIFFSRNSFSQLSPLI